MGYFTSGEKNKHTMGNGKHIKGISCDVRSCSFHDGENHCTADKVAIGPSYASSSTETICASFKPKTMLP